MDWRRRRSGTRSPRKLGAMALSRRPERQPTFTQAARQISPNLRQAFPLVPGQSGAALALGDGQLCLDYVSRPAAFARLYPKLLDGYHQQTLLSSSMGSRRVSTAWLSSSPPRQPHR